MSHNYKDHRKNVHEFFLRDLPPIFAFKNTITGVICKIEKKPAIKVDDLTPYYDFSIPDCLNWSIEETLEWLKNVVKLPQYSETFNLNYVNGRKLIFIQPRHLPLMNIHDFDDIKKICHYIKELYNIEYEGFDDGDCSLLAPKVVRYQYLLLKAKTGKYYQEITPREFLNRILMSIPEPPPSTCHWENIEPEKKENMKIAATGTKRLPGEKKDPSKFVGTEDLIKRKFIVNENLRYKMQIYTRMKDK